MNSVINSSITGALSDTCRVCLEKSSKLYPLEGHILNVDEYVSTMISYCTSVEVIIDVDLPNGVCLPCFKTIRIAYNFVKQFKETNDILLAELAIKKTKLENTSEESDQYDDTIREIESSEEPAIAQINKFDIDEDYCEPHTEVMLSEQENEDVSRDVIEPDSSSVPCLEAEYQINPEEEIIIKCINDDNSNGETTPTEVLSENDDGIHDGANIDLSLKKKPRKKQKKILSRYVCTICLKVFADFTRGLIKHIQYHHKNELFKCDRCSFDSELSLDSYITHYKECHLYQCSICDKKLASKSTFYYHLNSHNNSTEFLCPYPNCGKSFHTQLNLRKHIPIHSKIPNYVCSKCGKKFNTYDTFRYHNKTHDGRRNHLCSVCGRAFLQSVHLKYHMWHHTGIKQFRCDDCGRSYTSITQLKKHRRKYCGSSKSSEELKIVTAE